MYFYGFPEDCKCAMKKSFYYTLFCDIHTNILVKNTTFDNNVVNVSRNVTKCCMLIDTANVDLSHYFGGYGNHFGGKLSIPYLPKCVYV